MSLYLVVWDIAIEADSPEDAAREAKRIQTDPESEANNFQVQKVREAGDTEFSPRVNIDLDEIDG